MPKIPKISVRNQMERSVLVSSDQNIRDHLWRWSTHFGWNIPTEICRSIYQDSLSQHRSSVTWSIMADFGSMQASSHYQCSVCSYTTTDLSQLVMYSCSAMTGMYLRSGYMKICRKFCCFVVLYFKKAYMHFPTFCFSWFKSRCWSFGNVSITTKFNCWFPNDDALLEDSSAESNPGEVGR